jgi:hypothetical protein
MQEHSEPPTRAEELAELETVADALGHTSRLANLLRYIGEKYFHGESHQLTEYNIATEVFGRSKTVFDAGEDAIARVEAHRLRKRLKEFYEGLGKDHPIQLTIPLGTYIPCFTHRAKDHSPSLSGAPGNSAKGTGKFPALDAAFARYPGRVRNPLGDVLRLNGPRNWFFALLAVGLIIAAAIFYVVARSHAGAAVSTASRTPPPAESARPLGSPPPAAVPLRILAGYSGKPQTNSSGEAWESDNYFHGGGSWRRPPAPIARTSDLLLFQQWRIGDFTYDIPLQPGLYELHLYFVTSERSSESLSTFSVKINGNLVLGGFDINSDALGENIADERIFRDISPASDGVLHIDFTSERGAPQLNALELLPGIPHKQLPIRLVMQRTSFTDHSGQFWHQDNYFMNGRLSDQRLQVVGSPDQDLFAMERYGHFNYAIPVDPRDRYTLVLHFAEFYFGPGVPSSGVGSRVFRVMCNGETLLDNFDIYKEAGSLHALTKTFYHIKPSAQGKLNITFEPILNNATVSGIEVLDESQ